MPTPEIVTAHEADVGGITVRRLLPRAVRRTVGAWCFVDHAGPLDVGDGTMQVGPHPHTGLHTVTWMLDGELVHRDSLGSEQALRPGQVNLMTAGQGVVHAEQVPEGATGRQQLLQLWVAQPEATRHGPAAFEHHAEPPVLETASATATLLVGQLGEAVSTARSDWPIVGADLVVRAPTSLPVERSFEHAVIPLGTPVRVDGTVVEPGTLGYLPPGGGELDLAPVEGVGEARLVLLGGEPFPDRLAMFWNFVGRTRDELEEAAADWASGDPRFGEVGGGLPRTPVPSMAPRSR
ncbi:MAG TPA: pirin family protein [Acidimicrobiales bacterium]